MLYVVSAWKTESEHSPRHTQELGVKTWWPLPQCQHKHQNQNFNQHQKHQQQQHQISIVIVIVNNNIMDWAFIHLSRSVNRWGGRQFLQFQTKIGLGFKRDLIFNSLPELDVLQPSFEKQRPNRDPWSVSKSLWTSLPPSRPPRAPRPSWAGPAAVVWWRCDSRLHSRGLGRASWHQGSSGLPWRTPRVWWHCFYRLIPSLPGQLSRLQASGSPWRGAGHKDRPQGLPPTRLRSQSPSPPLQNVSSYEVWEFLHASQLQQSSRGILCLQRVRQGGAATPCIYQKNILYLTISFFTTYRPMMSTSFVLIQSFHLQYVYCQLNVFIKPLNWIEFLQPIRHLASQFPSQGMEVSWKCRKLIS